MRFEFGSQVLFTYFAGFFVLPFVLALLLGFHSNYIDLELSVRSLFAITLFVFSWSLSYYVSKLVIPSIRISYLNIFQQKLLWLGLAVIFLFVGMYFYLNYDLSYRQSGPRLSESGVIMKLLFLAKPIVFSYFFYVFFTGKKFQTYFSVEYITALLFGFFLVLTIFAAFEFLLLALVALYLFSNQWFKMVFYFEVTNGKSRLTLVFLTFSIGISLLFGIIFIGFANKLGFDGAMSYLFGSEGLYKTASYLYYRVSVFFNSFVMYVENYQFDFSLYDRSINILADAFNYRLSLIFGLEAQRPELTSLNRLNYVSLFASVQAKEIGTSPGYLGAFLMIFPSYVGVVLAGCYTTLLHRILNRVGGIFRYASPIPILLAFYFIFPFIFNPIDSFFLIGPESFKFILYLYVLVVVGQENKTFKGTSSSSRRL